VDYEIPGLGILVGMTQSNYEMDKGRSQVLTRIPFRFECKSEDSLRGKVDGASKTSAVIEELNRAGVKYESKLKRDNDNEVYGSTIEVQGYVRVTITFVGVKETGAIELYIKNYDNLTQVHSLLNPDQINDAFLEELGKFILRQPNQFMKHELSAEQKAQLAEMVKKANDEREKELREAEARELAEKKRETFKK
jgi:hypothetical protein